MSIWSSEQTPTPLNWHLIVNRRPPLRVCSWPRPQKTNNHYYVLVLSLRRLHITSHATAW